VIWARSMQEQIFTWNFDWKTSWHETTWETQTFIEIDYTELWCLEV